MPMELSGECETEEKRGLRERCRLQRKACLCCWMLLSSLLPPFRRVSLPQPPQPCCSSPAGLRQCGPNRPSLPSNRSMGLGGGAEVKPKCTVEGWVLRTHQGGCGGHQWRG